LKEKDVLLKEIHHRVKNNLQVISSILNLQSSFVSDENTLGILQESRNRIRSMAIIHENLYRTEDFASIKFDNYLRNLTGNLIASYSVDRRIEFDADLQEVDLVLDQAIPCGLLTNELITNALKYAWKGEEMSAKIRMTLEQEGDIIKLTIADNGVGLPQEFEQMQSDTLGLQLVTTLAEQLDAELKVTIEQGTEFQLTFENVKRVTIHPGTES
jgi:two-component sensor histidine kinase